MAWSLDRERNIMEVPLSLSNWSNNTLLSVFITIDFVAFFFPYVCFEDFIDFFNEIERNKMILLWLYHSGLKNFVLLFVELNVQT